MDIINKLFEWVGDKLQYVIQLFPTSPFKGVIAELDNMPYLEYVNYFIPVGQMVDIAVAWGSAIALFYLYSIIARWVKAIE